MSTDIIVGVYTINVRRGEMSKRYGRIRPKRIYRAYVSITATGEELGSRGSIESPSLAIAEAKQWAIANPIPPTKETKDETK